jgi:hypothetical protein
LSITRGHVFVKPFAIASQGVVSNPLVKRVNLISLTSAGTNEIFGNPVLHVGGTMLIPIGMPSSLAFGVPTVQRGAKTVTFSGIGTQLLFGNVLVKRLNSLFVTPITSSEAFGTVKVNRNIKLNSFFVPEAFGTVVVARGAKSLFVSSIVSISVVNSVTVKRGALNLSPVSISSGYTSGAYQLNLRIKPSSTASAFTTGNTIINRGAVTIGLSGVGTGFVSGLLSLHVSGINVLPQSISSQFATGNLSISRKIRLSGILSTEQFGTYILNSFRTVAVSSISSEQSVSVPNVLYGITFDGITSGQDFGFVSVQPEEVYVNLNSTLSAESFGVLRTSGVNYVNLFGINSILTINEPTIRLENQIKLLAITTKEFFGLTKVIYKYQTYLDGEYKRLRILKTDTDDKLKFIGITSNFKKLD